MITLPAKKPRKISEGDIQAVSIREMSRIPGVRVARNNNGMLKDERGIPVTYGLGNGSPDVVGILTVGGPKTTLLRLLSMPPIAIAFGIEFKKPGRYAERDQKAWHLVAERYGMRCAVCKSVEEAVAFIGVLRLEVDTWILKAKHA